jgi:cytidine deaminase
MLTEQIIAESKKAAKTVSESAYCPYSNFRVGSAVVDESGRIFCGCNVENASFGLTSCAERNAIFQAVAAGAKKITCVVLYTPTPKPTTTPCGACRQVINEFGVNALIISTCLGDEIFTTTLDTLLPKAFGPNNIEENNRNS